MFRQSPPLNKDGDGAPTVSVTPPSPSTTPRADHENDPLSLLADENAVDGATKKEKRSNSRPSSHHLQLKSLLQSSGAKKKKLALLQAATAAEEKKESSEFEEEGTASEYNDDELTDGMCYLFAYHHHYVQ